jgi:hypothetical protein
VQGQAADGGDLQRSVIDDARAWLNEVLAAGPRPALELRHEAAAHGVGEKALYVARKTAGITPEKERAPYGGWLWSLTPHSGGGGEDGARPGP